MATTAPRPTDGESEDMPELTVSQQKSPGDSSVSLDAVTTLIHSFASMMTAMESRITEQLRDNTRNTGRRFDKMEADFAKHLEASDKRFEAIESSVHDHHAEEERRRVAAEARIQPVRGVFAWLWHNWRDVLLLAIGIIALLTFLTDWFGHALGLTPINVIPYMLL